MRLKVLGKLVFLPTSLHPPYILLTLSKLPKYLPCISWDAKRIWRLSLIFRYLLRPEMMVVYTWNFIYGFSTKLHTPRRGGYTEGLKYTRFSKSRHLTEGKGSPYANSTHLAFHAKPPDGSFNPLQPKYP
jgi:hypothetical protein